MLLKELHPTFKGTGVGRYSFLPHATKRRITTNLKTKNNQNCQKIEQCRSLTTKELKKKHSSRFVGGVETGSQGGEDAQQGGGWDWVGEVVAGRWVVPHSLVDKPGRTIGELDRPCHPGFQLWEKKASKSLM